MASDSSDQNADNWKQKYYIQLDQLEAKEKEWALLDAALKKALARISLVAEGTSEQIDKYLQDVRHIIKDKVNPHRLDLVIDDLSKVLAKAEQQNTSPAKNAADILQLVLQNIKLPAAWIKKIKHCWQQLPAKQMHR